MPHKPKYTVRSDSRGINVFKWGRSPNKRDTRKYRYGHVRTIKPYLFWRELRGGK